MGLKRESGAGWNCRADRGNFVGHLIRSEGSFYHSLVFSDDSPTTGSLLSAIGNDADGGFTLIMEAGMWLAGRCAGGGGGVPRCVLGGETAFDLITEQLKIQRAA